jgi:hypothetical protein
MKQAVKNVKEFYMEAGLGFVYLAKSEIKQTELHSGMYSLAYVVSLL